MPTKVVCLAVKTHQILNAVVIEDAVDMMNDLVR
jgi:hypothetical protein